MLTIKAIIKLLLLVLWSLPMVAAQLLARPFLKGQDAYIIPKFWHKGIACIMGLRVEICGNPVHDRQIIYISNHLSYLDIPVIGSYLKASFVAKEDIAHWPVIGFLSTLQQTAFISRSSNHAKKVANALDTMLKEGKSLILFPEGTSSSGIEVLPFKSSLFSLACPKDTPPIPIQPFVLELVNVNGVPLTPASRDLYSWYGDMDFGPHIWDFLKNNGARVRLTFLDVIAPTQDDDRKTLCKNVEGKIISGLAATKTL